MLFNNWKNHALALKANWNNSIKDNLKLSNNVNKRIFKRRYWLTARQKSIRTKSWIITGHGKSKGITLRLADVKQWPSWSVFLDVDRSRSLSVLGGAIPILIAKLIFSYIPSEAGRNNVMYSACGWTFHSLKSTCNRFKQGTQVDSLGSSSRLTIHTFFNPKRPIIGFSVTPH